MPAPFSHRKARTTALGTVLPNAERQVRSEVRSSTAALPYGSD
jgi:hypothetical protein